MKSATDTKKLKDIMERERIFQFLVVLNPEFDQASGKVLGREPFPSMDEPFAHIWGEESRKKLMVGNSKNPIAENSALAVSNPPFYRWKIQGRRQEDGEQE